MIHLDTTLLVDLLRESRRSAGSTTPVDPSELGPAHYFLSQNSDEAVGVSVFVACELFAGAAASKHASAEEAAVEAVLAGVRIVYPDERFAAMYGELFAELRKRGATVSALDLLIGTAARVDGAPLVTRNTADFERIPGLLVLSY